MHLKVLKITSLEDWPNIVLHGLDKYDDLILDIARNLSGDECKCMKQDVISEILISRPSDSMFPLIYVDITQEYSLLLPFFKDYLSKRSILNRSKRHVVVLGGNFSVKTVNMLIKRIMDEFSYNAVFIVTANVLAGVPRFLRD